METRKQIAAEKKGATAIIAPKQFFTPTQI